jgi:hypothetical protein
LVSCLFVYWKILYSYWFFIQLFLGWWCFS